MAYLLDITYTWEIALSEYSYNSLFLGALSFDYNNYHQNKDGFSWQSQLWWIILSRLNQSECLCQEAWLWFIRRTTLPKKWVHPARLGNLLDVVCIWSQNCAQPLFLKQGLTVQECIFTDILQHLYIYYLSIHAAYLYEWQRPTSLLNIVLNIVRGSVVRWCSSQHLDGLAITSQERCDCFDYISVYR